MLGEHCLWAAVRVRLLTSSSVREIETQRFCLVPVPSLLSGGSVTKYSRTGVSVALPHRVKTG
jgi:hypothetical protein